MPTFVSVLAQTVVAASVVVALSAVRPAEEALASPPAEGTMRNFVATVPLGPAPDKAFLDEKGVEHRLSEYRGKVVLVNFWAAWCPACIAEMPTLDRLQASLGGDDFTVLALAQQSGDASAVSDFLKRRGLTHLTVLLDEQRKLGRAFDQWLFPTTVLLDRDGREVGRLVGPAEWDSAEAASLIRYFMGGKAVSAGEGLKGP